MKLLAPCQTSSFTIRGFGPARWGEYGKLIAMPPFTSHELGDLMCLFSVLYHYHFVALLSNSVREEKENEGNGQVAKCPGFKLLETSIRIFVRKKRPRRGQMVLLFTFGMRSVEYKTASIIFLLSQEADMAVAPFRVINSRIPYVDYTSPCEFQDAQVYFLLPNTTDTGAGNGHFYLRPLRWEVYAAVGGCLLWVLLMLTFTRYAYWYTKPHRGTRPDVTRWLLADAEMVLASLFIRCELTSYLSYSHTFFSIFFLTTTFNAVVIVTFIISIMCWFY